jgi:hypothetical protein
VTATRRGVTLVGATTVTARAAEQAIVPRDLVDGVQEVAASATEQRIASRVGIGPLGDADRIVDQVVSRPSTEHVVATPSDRVIAAAAAGNEIGSVATVQLVGTAIADQRVVVVRALRILDGDESVGPISARHT